MSQAAGGGCWVRAGGLGAQGPSGSTRCRADGSCLSGAALWVTQSARWGRVTVRM